MKSFINHPFFLNHMKTLFIESKFIGKIKVPKNIIEKLPKTIALFFTIQFIDSLEDVKKDIEATGRVVKVMKGKHTKYMGQIYGCNLEKFEGVDAYFYIGDGLFHPKALALGNDKPIHIWNPVSEKYSVMDREAVYEELHRQKAAFSRFLTADKIGVLVTTKPGQSYLKYALKLKDKYPDKKFYYIVMDTINFEGLEDFNFVECWVNTACPRIGWDDTKRTRKPMLDLGCVL
jgi:2-(3-amino-3-carboxypropyl)histidine synthase